MSANDEIIINAILAGTREYLANAQLVAGANDEMAVSTKALGDSAATTTKRTYLMNQALFTVRRLLYGTTLAVIGIGAEALRMGFNFDKGMQVARVSMLGFLPTTQAVNDELNKLYNFAAYTPFQFQDIVLATRKILPFTSGVREANGLINSLVNALAGMGVTTASALNRGALALSHMLSMGKVTGLALNQLARDNIPMILALAKYYNTTTENIRNMVKQGVIPASIGVKALNQYIAQTPGFAGAALRVATRSLSGAFTTFKDVIMKSFGSAEGGLFSGFQHLFQGVDIALSPLLAGGKNISIYQLAQAFDQVLSPKTHIVIDLFELLKGVVDGVVLGIHALSIAISLVLAPLGWFSSGGGSAQFVMHALGMALGLAVVALAGYRTWMMLSAIATEIWTIKTKAATIATMLYEVWILRAEYAELLTTKATWLFVFAQTALIAILDGARLALATFAVALDLAFGPVGWILLGITALVFGVNLLYYKWKWFHDAVNGTFNWITGNWHSVAIALSAAFLPILLAYEALKYIVAHWQSLQNTAKTALTGGMPQATPAQQAAAPHRSFWSGLWHSLTHTPGSAGSSIPGMALGGSVVAPGLSWVGEHGPELLSMPVGAKVVPLNEQAKPGGLRSLLDSLVVSIEPAPVILDGKKVGDVVFKKYAIAQAMA